MNTLMFGLAPWSCSTRLYFLASIAWSMMLSGTCRWNSSPSFETLTGEMVSEATASCVKRPCHDLGVSSILDRGRDRSTKGRRRRTVIEEQPVIRLIFVSFRLLDHGRDHSARGYKWTVIGRGGRNKAALQYSDPATGFISINGH